MADLRDWPADVEPDLIQAARDAGVTWDALAPVLRVGDRRAAQRRHARLPQAAARDRQAADAGENVPQDVQDVPHDVPAAADVPAPAGRDWDDSDLCLWRGGQRDLERNPALTGFSQLSEPLPLRSSRRG